MQRELVVRASAGDHAAFSELAASAVAGLYRAAYLILRDPDVAHDAVQDALIAAWRGIRGLRDPDRFDAWLRKLTVRSCYRLARSERRRIVREVELLATHADVMSDDGHRLMADRDQLDRAFIRLSSRDRAVLVLHFYLDLPQAEVADVMGVPLGTMKSRLNRATQAMRAAVDAQDRPSAVPQEGIA
jgi:RNA polymerase sigma-70 factor (ECF subfamily)